MSQTIFIPSALKKFSGDNEEVVVEASTVREALIKLTQKYPDLKQHFFDKDQNLRNFIKVFLGDEDIKNLDNLDTLLKDGDELSIIPAIAGGDLSNEEITRYSRHLSLPEVGKEGQLRLKKAKILLIGVGGLGSPLAMYLAAAGIGTLGIVDFDVVETSNLQRQIIHSTQRVGKSKLESAKDTIKSLNPNVMVNLYEETLTSKNAMKIIKDYDLVIDGTDNFPTRYLVNDACVLLDKPNIYGSIFRFEGQASVFNHEGGPCYRCLFPEPPPPGLVPSCAEGGVLGVLPGVIGTIQATEGIKLMLGKGTSLSGRLLTYNALQMKFKELKITKNKDCPICGENPTIKELIDYDQFCGIQKKEIIEDEITVFDLKDMKEQNKRFILIDVREKDEWDLCKIDGATLVPLSGLKQGKLGDLENIEKDKEIVLHCKGGVRSLDALNILKEKGYTNLKSVAGGINAWAKKIDNSVPVY